MEPIIKVDEYYCMTNAPGYLYEAEHINIILHKIKELLNIWFPKETIMNIDYGVYLYEDKTFNAFSAKKDNGYVIAFSTTSASTSCIEVSSYDSCSASSRVITTTISASLRRSDMS